MKYLLFILIFLAACSSDKPDGRTEAEVLYKEAEELMKSERYILATEKLNTIKTQHPYSFYATPAELMQADILFLQENFIEAAASYILFRDFHPRHEKIPYVVYKIGESYFKQIPDTIYRDLEPAIEAIRYYEEVIAKYPDTSYKADAETGIKKCTNMLRKKDQYIADFYFKTDAYGAARYWYLDILSNHSNEKIRRHAMERVVKASLELKEYQTCINYAEKFYELVDKKTKKVIQSVKDTCSKREKTSVQETESSQES
jgi:outer membrane protein assembly factor BamD